MAELTERSATILITRPEPGASETAACVRALGHVPVLAPVLQIQPVLLNPPRTITAIAITSSQALAGLPSALRALPLYAVGDASARRAFEAGFRWVETASGSADDLARLLADRLPRGATLLLASGAGHNIELADTLRSTGYRVIRRIAYRTRPAEALDIAAIAALEADEVDFMLIFSKASAQYFVNLARAARVEPGLRRVIAIAISADAAIPLRALSLRNIRIAIAPDQQHMLALLS